MCTKKVQELIERYISDFDTVGCQNFINIIATASKESIECLIESRETLKNADIDISIFDAQLSKMLAGYKRIVDVIK